MLTHNGVLCINYYNINSMRLIDLTTTAKIRIHAVNRIFVCGFGIGIGIHPKIEGSLSVIKLFHEFFPLSLSLALLLLLDEVIYLKNKCVDCNLSHEMNGSYDFTFSILWGKI